jgi:hypothetical protein
MLDFDPPDATGEDGGMDAAPFEAGTTDAARNDSGRVDGDIQDAGSSDAEEFEPDAAEEGGTGESDAGESDAGEPDSGATDAGRIDAAPTDAGTDSGRIGCSTDRDCDDGNPCTSDICVPGVGCTLMPLSGVACDDGNACSVFDTCWDGRCIGTARTCDDRNPCTSDTCVPGVGCTYRLLSGVACDDENACTVSDTCIMGTCTGTPRTCPDRTCYMVTGCDPMLGCRYDPAPPRTPCTTDGGRDGTCDGRGRCLSLSSDG